MHLKNTLLSAVVAVLALNESASALPKMQMPIPAEERTSAKLKPDELKDIGIDEKLGANLDFNGGSVNKFV